MTQENLSFEMNIKLMDLNLKLLRYIISNHVPFKLKPGLKFASIF